MLFALGCSTISFAIANDERETTEQHGTVIQRLEPIKPRSPVPRDKVMVYAISVGFEWAKDAPPGGRKLTYEELQLLRKAAGVKLRFLGFSSVSSQSLELPKPLPLPEVEKLCERLKQVPSVQYAEPEVGVSPLGTIPDDPFFIQQWDLQGLGSGLNMTTAWNLSKGRGDVVVAIVDSGVLSAHRGLQGKLLPGHDFISDPEISNDGDGRDSNPADPGDWLTSAEQAANPTRFSGCDVRGDVFVVGDDFA